MIFTRAIKTGIVACACAIVLSCTAYAQTVTTNVTVDESNIIKPSDRTMLGMSDTWDTWRMYLGNGVNTETSKRYQDMINGCLVPVNMQRMSGADSKDFYWKETLGPMNERGDGSPYSRNFGLVEWIKSVMSVNKDAEFTFAINIVNDTVENHADLVRFLTLTPDHPNAVGKDGTNWAHKRVELGILDPVNITVFELGNEIYNEGYVPTLSTGTVTAEEGTKAAENYVADCKAAISAMKAVNPDIDFAMCGYSSGTGGYDHALGNENNNAACAWNRKILQELSDDCGYIVDHKYYYDYNFRLIQQEIEVEFENLLNDIPAEKRPKLYFSEYGCWVEKVSADNAMEYLPWPTSLKGALTDAKFLNGFLINSPHVGMAALFSSSGSTIDTPEKWGAGFSYLRVFNDGKIYATVPAEMLKVFNEAVGDGNEGENVVKTTLSAPTDNLGIREHSYFAGWKNFPTRDSLNNDGEYKTPIGLLTVSSHTTVDGGINLILVNTNETVGHNIKPDFNNSYKLKEELIVTSEFLTDNNIPGTSDLVYMKRNLINDENELTTHYIPPKSMVVLKLVPLSYEYEAERNMITHFSNSTTLEDGTVAVGPGNFSLSVELYENKAMSSLNKAVLLIPKQGVKVADVVDNMIENIDNLCYIGQADVKRNIAYFDVALGDYPEGNYQAIVGNFEGGNYEVIDFYYRGKNTISKKIESIEFKNAVDSFGVKFISNNDYLVNTEITFDENFKESEPCKVTVARGKSETFSDREIVNIGYVTSIPGEKVKYDFYMPEDAVSGNYTVDFAYMDGDGLFRSSRAEFYFNKPDETISIVTVPVNQSDEEITFDNISKSEKIKFYVKNNGDKETEYTAVVAFFSKDNKVIYVAIDDDNLVSANEKGEVEIALANVSDVKNADHISIYIWKNTESIVPYSNVYYIK